MRKTTSLAGGRALAIAGLVAACSGSPAPGPAPAGPRSLASAAAPAPARVLLYGLPDLEDHTRLRLQPLACALGGRLAATPRACGEAMPAAARVKLVGGETITVERSRRDFKDEAGDQVYRAPLGPQCCMYNACQGETIPYLGAPGTAPAHGVLAIWPDDAEIGLTTYDPSAGEADRAGPPDFVLDQLVRVGSLALAAGRPRRLEHCLSCAHLQWFDGKAWRSAGGVEGAQDGFFILATSDLDGDGRPEAVVREIWRNDYGMTVLGDDWSKPLMRYSCGNI